MLAGDLRAIFAASTSRQTVLEFASSIAEKWHEKGYPKLAKHHEEHVEECLACLDFSERHQRRVRTTNGEERLSQEIKRRTRVVRIFPNHKACLGLMLALAVEQS